MKIQSLSDRCRKLAATLVVAMVGTSGYDAAGQVPAGALVQGDQVISGGESYQVIDSSMVPTATADSTDDTLTSYGSPAARLEALGSVPMTNFAPATCSSCNTGCGGACGGATMYSGYGGGMSCGPTCQPYRYVTVEGLYMTRLGEDTFTRAQNFRLDGFDFEWAPRITIGSVPNCYDGIEGSFTGPFEWDMAASLAGAGNLSTLYSGSALPAGSLSSFINADFQRQTYEAEYLSGEVSKTCIGWEVAKLLIGARYIDYDELYRYETIDGATNGLLQSRADNVLLGAQVGVDLLYPVGRFVYTDFRGRAGAYLNLADSDVYLENAGSIVLNNSGDDEDLAGVFEVGGGIRYQLGEMLSVRAGAELWYLVGIATARDQIGSQLLPATGRSPDVDDEVVIAGVTVGAELKF
ncbi:MAG: hypothetical protein AAGA03_03555 [Planctomycetota bacterium]